MTDRINEIRARWAPDNDGLPLWTRTELTIGFIDKPGGVVFDGLRAGNHVWIEKAPARSREAIGHAPNDIACLLERIRRLELALRVQLYPPDYTMPAEAERVLEGTETEEDIRALEWEV